MNKKIIRPIRQDELAAFEAELAAELGQ